MDELLEYRARKLLGGGDYGKGKDHFFRGNYKEAADLFRAALRGAGQSNLGVDFYRYLSSALLHTKQYQEALDALAQIPENNLEGQEYYMAALGKKGLGDLNEAQANIELAIDKNHSKSIYHITKMRIIKQTGSRDALSDAIQQYEDLFRNNRGEDSPLGQD